MEQIRLNAMQIQNTLKYIHDTQSDDVKQSVFGELGHQCYLGIAGGGWLERFKGKPAEYLKSVNDDHSCQYWESILPEGDENTYILTGAVVDRCACSLAGGKDAPGSLCDYCCKSFQKHFFSALFDRDVEIEITAAFLKGDNRCSTRIRLV